MEYLLIDGYNIINAWDDIFKLDKEPLEDIRVRFLNLLSNYQGYRKIIIIVVFDAHLVKGSLEKHEKFDNMTIVFTKENETADNYIEKFVYRASKSDIVRVVTSDYLEQTMVLSNGGFRMSPRELRKEIITASKNLSFGTSKFVQRNNTIMSNIKPELLEQLEELRRGKF